MGTTERSEQRGTQKIPLFRRLRVYFVTGLVIFIPIVVTLYIVFQLFSKIDGLLRGVYGRVEFLSFKIGEVNYAIPGLGLLTLILIVLLLGLLAQTLVGTRVIRSGESILSRIPLISRIYVAIQQISHVFLTEKRSVFKRAVLIQYPRKGIYSIGFLTATADTSTQDNLRQRCATIFLPTTPNPTSGYLLFVPEEEVIPMSITIEEALKLVISAGSVVPEGPIVKIPSLDIDQVESSAR